MYNCIILSGIPCSGKSRFVKNYAHSYCVISCDNLRGNNYIFSKENEDEIWNKFYDILNTAYTNIIIDNTNCKQIYIDKIKKNLNKDFNWNIVVIRFDISLRKAKIRNIFRYLKTGKYIPNEVMNNMYKNYNKLWKK
jgi:predicted kinase